MDLYHQIGDSTLLEIIISIAFYIVLWTILLIILFKHPKNKK